MKKTAIGISVFLLGFVAFLTSYITATVNTLESVTPGFTPYKDAVTAEKHAPVLISNDTFGFPIKCLYRAARDGAGNIHIAYHPVWEYERNDSGGLMPTLSRLFYTGGLRIQRIMFGKGDVEVIAVTVDPRGNTIGLSYERPRDYNPSTFTVKHEKVKLDKSFSGTPRFRVSSWNHLFEIAEGSASTPGKGERSWRCEPEYFTDELWEEYTMVRLQETRLRKSRAHHPWERISAK